MFSDVNKTAWYAGSVAKVYELGLMLGDSEKTFNPAGSVTLAETVALASRLYSIYHDDGYVFVNGTPWYQKYVNYALNHGILEKGYSDYSRPATRAEFASILAMALPKDEIAAINTVEDGAIPDVPGHEPYCDSVYILYRAGILTGNDIKGTFSPKSNIERCSVAAIMMRMVDKTSRRSFSLYVSKEDEFPEGEAPLPAARQYGGTNIGINFWFDNASAAFFDEILPQIAATEAHIKIGVQHQVDTKAGYSVTPMDDAEFSTISMCIEKAQAFGIKVDMLMIYMEDKAAWQNPIEPTGKNVAAFFRNHKAAAMNVAKLCDNYEIPVMGLVNECDALTNSDNVLYWADEVNTIKAAYPKLKLTCASTTWSGETRKLLDYKKAGTDNICNYLDYLGINLYPVLTMLPVAQVTDDDLRNGWYGNDYPTASTQDCSMFQLLTNISEAYDKPLLITEIGCAPKEFGFADPLNYNAETKNSENNKHVQYLYLKTAYDVLGQCDFIAGIYIWDAFDTWTPYYWLDNTELVHYISDYYKRVFSR